MSLRIDTSEWISGYLLIGETGLGVLGSAIPSTGDNGAGYAYNDLSLPADAGKEICGRITTWPTAGTLFAYDDTSFEFSGAPDGSYSFQYQLYVDGVAVGSPQTVTLIVGVANGTATGSVSALSIAAPTATASGTSGVVNGSASGGLAVLSLSAPSATASGTAGVINGVAAGSPSELSIVAISAVGAGTTAGNGVAVGTLSVITLSALSAVGVGTVQANGQAAGSPASFYLIAPSAVAGAMVYTRAPDGSGPSVVRATSYRPANVQTSTRH